MKKYMVTIYLPEELDDNFWALIPRHRALINELMEKEIIFSYAINQFRTMGWIIINGDSEKEIAAVIEQFPIYQYITYDVDELFIFDSSLSGLPKLVMN